jgi:serine protease Do
MAKDVMTRLINEGKVVRGYLGAYIQELTPGLAKSFGYDKQDGILVGEVAPGGPAAKAGVKSGDILLSIDGKDAGRDVRAFRNRVAWLKPGDKTTLEVWRDGKRQKLELTIGEAPAKSPGVASSGGGARGLSEWGLSLADPTPQLRRRTGLPDDAAGAVVMEVAPGSLAAKADLRPGDVIVDVQGQAVKSAEEARAELTRQDPVKGVRLRVQRGEMSRFVFLKSGA